jgi:tetratricopeptide (TPR) repeat protein
MGMAQSKYNIQEAITSFFKSFQCKVKCIQSLFALCSIGLLKNDMKLISAVFKELDTLKDSLYKFDIVKLKSIYYCLQKEFSKAIRCISKYIHEYPSDTKSWIELCLCLKRSKYYDLSLTIGNVIFKINTQDDPIFYDCIQFLLLKQLEKKQFKDNENILLKMFQKMLHIFPGK